MGRIKWCFDNITSFVDLQIRYDRIFSQFSLFHILFRTASTVRNMPKHIQLGVFHMWIRSIKKSEMHWIRDKHRFYSNIAEVCNSAAALSVDYFAVKKNVDWTNAETPMVKKRRWKSSRHWRNYFRTNGKLIKKSLVSYTLYLHQRDTNTQHTFAE